jgi:hypothetical protein
VKTHTRLESTVSNEVNTRVRSLCIVDGEAIEGLPNKYTHWKVYRFKIQVLRTRLNFSLPDNIATFSSRSYPADAAASSQL